MWVYALETLTFGGAHFTVGTSFYAKTLNPMNPIKDTLSFYVFPRSVGFLQSVARPALPADKHWIKDVGFRVGAILKPKPLTRKP